MPQPCVRHTCVWGQYRSCVWRQYRPEPHFAAYTSAELRSICLLQITLGGDAFLHAEGASGAERRNARKIQKVYAEDEVAWRHRLAPSSRRLVRMEVNVLRPTKKKNLKASGHSKMNELQNLILCSISKPPRRSTSRRAFLGPMALNNSMMRLASPIMPRTISPSRLSIVQNPTLCAARSSIDSTSPLVAAFGGIAAKRGIGIASPATMVSPIDGSFASKD